MLLALMPCMAFAQTIPAEGQYYTIKTGDYYLYFEAANNDKLLKGSTAQNQQAFWELSTEVIGSNTYHWFKNVKHDNYIIAGSSSTFIPSGTTPCPFSNTAANGTNYYRDMMLVPMGSGTYKIWSYRRQNQNVSKWFRYDSALGYVVWEANENAATVFTIEGHTPSQEMIPISFDASNSTTTTIVGDGPHYLYSFTSSGLRPYLGDDFIPGSSTSTTGLTYSFTSTDLPSCVTLTTTTSTDPICYFAVSGIPTNEQVFHVTCTAQMDGHSTSATATITLDGAQNPYEQIAIPNGEGYYLIHNGGGYLHVQTDNGSLENKKTYTQVVPDSTCLWHITHENSNFVHAITNTEFYSFRYPFYNSTNTARLRFQNSASYVCTYHGGENTSNAYFGIVKKRTGSNGTYMLANYRWVYNATDFCTGNGDGEHYKPVLGLSDNNPREGIGATCSNNYCWWTLDKQTVSEGITMPVIKESSVFVQSDTPYSQEYATMLVDAGDYTFSFRSTHGLVWSEQANWEFPNNSSDGVSYAFSFVGDHPSQVSLNHSGATLTLSLTERLGAPRDVVVRCTATYGAYTRTRDLRVHINYVTRTPITTLNGIDPNGCYLLTSDIEDASAIATLSSFSGDIDGNYKTIKGLTNPLFGTLSGTVKNLRFENVNVSTGTDVGAIANTATGNAKIYNCGILSGSISGSGKVGGLVGAIEAGSNVRVVNCYNYASVSGGTYAAGIVGYNGGTISLSTINEMKIVNTIGVRITNCMVYGDVKDATNISPVYCGNHIDNIQNFTEYNYWRSHADIQYTEYKDQLVIGRDEFLTRFPFFRHILNTHREMAAYFLYGTGSNRPFDGQVDEIGHWVLDKDIAPYPIIEPWIKNTHHTTQDINNHLPNTNANYAGRLLTEMGQNGNNAGYLSVTVNIAGTSRTINLPITDMDTLNYDFTWGKVVLPFANEFDGWTRDYSKVITGWKITSITGGTAGTYENYNFGDRDCTAKDLYSNSGYIFAQGGNYIVPYGVTAITIDANLANAFYLCDPSGDMGYNTKYETESEVHLGWQAPTTYHGNRVYTKLTDLVNNALANTNNPHEQAIVLVGNYHYDQLVHQNGTDMTTSTKDLGFNVNKAVTIMSTDDDNNQEPDYGWYSYHFQDRTRIPAMRFDFVPNIGMGMAGRVKGSIPNPTIGIWHGQYWFELTETCVSFMSECEINARNSDSFRFIANSGYFIQIVNARSAAATKLSYIQLGGNIYLQQLYPGPHMAENLNVNLCPIIVTGGEIEECFMTGKDKSGSSTAIGNHIYFWCSGGRIHKYLSACRQKPSQDQQVDVTAKVDHAIIRRFFGGGTSPMARITGNIDITMNNSLVDFYCGGPEFGDMFDGRTVTTHATGTTFGEYYGAGFGGTATTKENKTDVTRIFDSDYCFPMDQFTSHYHNAWLNYDADKGGFNANYEFEFIIYAGSSLGRGVSRFHVGHIDFDLATTGNVTNELTNCTVKHNFFGAGCQGKVVGTVTSTLNNCTVLENVYGGGYKAAANETKVYPQTQPTMACYTFETGLFSDFIIPEPEVWHWEQGTAGTKDVNNKILYTDTNMPELGKVNDNITLTIDGRSHIGTLENGALKKGTGDVFGGGFESQSLKNTEVIIKGRTCVLGNVYGGGNMAKVGGKTKVIFNGTTTNRQ